MTLFAFNDRTLVIRWSDVPNGSEQRSELDRNATRPTGKQDGAGTRGDVAGVGDVLGGDADREARSGKLERSAGIEPRVGWRNDRVVAPNETIRRVSDPGSHCQSIEKAFREPITRKYVHLVMRRIRQLTTD